MAVDKMNRKQQDLERYGVWVKTGPDEVNEHNSTHLELVEIENPDQDELLITDEEEELLGALKTPALPDLEYLEESDAESFENDLSTEQAMHGVGTSQDVLSQIEKEISALRNEMQQLKNTVTSMKSASVSSGQDDPVEGGGFFDEEEDETIALTGDELDTILDTADMVGESSSIDEENTNSDAPDVEEIARDNDIQDRENNDDELIDFSEDFTELDLDDIGGMDENEVETELELPVHSSIPEEFDPEESSETIEIDINGVDELSDIDNSEENPVVHIDDIETVFEDITDFDDFGLSENSGLGSELDSISRTEQSKEAFSAMSSSEDTTDTESFEDADFDEGESVDIDLTGTEEIESLSENNNLGIDIEEISIDDFGLEDSDELAVPEEPSAKNNEDPKNEIETIDFEPDSADSIELQEVEDIEDLQDEDVNLIPVDAEPDTTGIEIDSSMESDDFEIEDFNLMDLDDDDILDFPLDETTDAIEAVEESPLDDFVESVEVIEELDNDFIDENDAVHEQPSGNDSNDLPGTEDLDLSSLDALVTEASSVDSPDPEETYASTAAQIRGKTKTALELSSLPGDLQKQIREVLVYMDQLLESLPDEKIQEFAQSEHFDVYKKIFEELGINN